jgi:hypothetical protein
MFPYFHTTLTNRVEVYVLTQHVIIHPVAARITKNFSERRTALQIAPHIWLSAQPLAEAFLATDRFP